MKSIRVHEFGGPEVLKLETVPDLSPGPGQVLIKIQAVGINPVETYMRAGNYPVKPPLPYTPGTDAAGTVAAIGSEVDRFRLGDRVYTAGTVSGAYSEFALCRIDQVYPLPAHVSFEQGAALNVPYATAYRALYVRGHGEAGQTVLIHGATGGVGLAATQFAAAAGLIVIGTGGTEKGRELVKQNGATHVLDHKDPNYLDQLMKLTNGRGVNLILEMLANVNLGKDLSLLATNGRVVVIGSRGPVEINPRDLMRTQGTIVGLLGGVPEETAKAHQAIGAGLKTKVVNPIIGKTFSLAEAAKAHEEIMQSSAFGKIILKP